MRRWRRNQRKRACRCAVCQIPSLSAVVVDLIVRYSIGDRFIFGSLHVSRHFILSSSADSIPMQWMMDLLQCMYDAVCNVM